MSIVTVETIVATDRNEKQHSVILEMYVMMVVVAAAVAADGGVNQMIVQRNDEMKRPAVL